ncbi:MAG: class I SAM-dependent methyltransferase, partial [Candidatus Dadabacteria bacterium]|nr:class I SAM-dependent methyltransferase [Candidatus Dadabacteria bacterium]
IKHNFIREFIEKTKPEFVIDMGCNTGEYSETALLSGAERVLGFDYDQGALELAYERAKNKNR